MSPEFSSEFHSLKSDEAGTVIRGKYGIIKKLGEGGFGETFLAEDRFTGRPYVIKRLSWKTVPDWKTIELFEREARVLSHMDHPKIPKFYDFFTEESEGETRIYLVQEFIDGKNLADQIKEGKHFTEREVIEIALQVVEILEYLHGFSPAIVHRDIKPSNLLIDQSGGLHLIDFGAVRDKVLHWQKTEGSGFTVVGTYGYMPFEQFQGQALPASDIYSLGVSLITLLSHKEPHEISSSGSRFEFEPHVNVSKDFQAVLRKMTEHRVEDRYSSVLDLKKDLLAILEGRTPSVVVSKPVKEKNTFAVAFFIVSLVAVILGFWLFRSPEPVIAPTAPAQPAVETPVPLTPVPAGPVVRGQLLYDGKLVSEITTSQPSFWFRDEKKGTVTSADVKYLDGRFEFRGLPPGEYGVSVQFDTNPENPISYPGDLRAWQVFTVAGHDDSLINVEFEKVIHMTSPEDNNVRLRDWGQQCETGRPKLPSGTVKFQWKPLEKNVTYDYSISRISCPYTARESMASGSTTGTSFQVDLPKSKDGEYYILQLYARKDGKNIGMLMTHGANGYGWDYRFRTD